ncbi:MAG: hypothetical protein ISS93_03420, partial [Candidatus Aenigmarchaeota archaeon]|nr:hypothetical protein [Candidatus Aenigmarchaeota archaeon]
SLNMKNRETQKISGIVLIESKNKALSANPVAKVYAQDIEKISSAEAIVLFGSLLEEKEKANDADVFFLIKNKKHVKKITADCLETSKTKTKPIVPLIMTCNDMKNKIQEQNPVILEILKSGVVVFGEDAIVEVLSNV